MREEEAILKEDTQTETSSPVCSHNEWDPLEVNEEEKKGQVETVSLFKHFS